MPQPAIGSPRPTSEQQYYVLQKIENAAAIFSSAGPWLIIKANILGLVFMLTMEFIFEIEHFPIWLITQAYIVTVLYFIGMEKMKQQKSR